MQEKPLNILLVDDNTHEPEFFRDAFQKLGINARLIYSPKATDAINEMLSRKVDLIFLDIHMPGMPGTQFLKEIKTNETYGHLPVIIYTICANEREIRECHKAGALFFVVKPYSCMTS